MKAFIGAVNRSLVYLLVPLVFIALYLVFIWSPVEKVMGPAQKIFYFHVAGAQVAFLSFFVVAVLGVLTLIKPTRMRHIAAGVSAEIGTLFTTVTLITGMIWGKTAWNTWWTWEPRLTTTLILWFIFVAYLFVRNMEGSWDKIARLSAVFGIIGFLNVPIVYMSIRWWNSKLHPVVFGEGKSGSGGGVEPEMLFTLLFCTFTITVLYAVLMQKGIEIEKMRLVLKEKKQKVFTKLAG
ncbi:cytochrome c biogenesis protein [Bacillus marinisedimentorum]|uniref:cytochrome c biogenesis protein n=1 Tax=Bacillus marinisedimentorum TaxID=1821260 RepID=UPI0008731992|nr:cytochrome c biogenesis protein CcsA [Bacillus marinisedimentorum]